MQHYGEERLAFGFHRFPLPYHHSAFFAWQAGGAIKKMFGTDALWRWVDLFFGESFPNQQNFSNAATATMSADAVIGALGQAAQAHLSLSDTQRRELVEVGLAYDGPHDDELRASWKYGCSRAVSGTPTFMVNGVLVAAEPSWTLGDWTKLIDPLLRSATTLASHEQCFAGSENLCSCSELIERHIITGLDDCTQSAAIEACKSGACNSRSTAADVLV
jgi:hypothetical protein